MLVVLRHGVLRGANVRVSVVHADRDYYGWALWQKQFNADKKASEEACMLLIAL